MDTNPVRLSSCYATVKGSKWGSLREEAKQTTSDHEDENVRQNRTSTGVMELILFLLNGGALDRIYISALIIPVVSWGGFDVQRGMQGGKSLS